MKRILMSAIILFLAIGVLNAAPIEYPKEKTLNVIVATPPGNSVDAAARIYVEFLKKEYNYNNIVVINLPGAATTIGTKKVLTEESDGYTILFASVDQVSASQSLNSANFNMAKDFVPVSIVASGPFAFATQKGKYKDLNDFVEQNKNREVTFAGIGYSGATNFVSMHVLNSLGIKSRVIPYNSIPQILTDVMEGRVDLIHITVQSGNGLVTSGKLDALAVTSTTRSKYLPNVPTYKEASGIEVSKLFWKGVFVKTGTPQNIVNDLKTSTEKVKAQPEFIEAMHKIAIDVTKNTTIKENIEFIEAENKTFSNLMKTYNMQKQ